LDTPSAVNRRPRASLSSYWALQLAGWAAYAMIAAATLIPVFPPQVIPRLFLIKGVRAALGIPFSDVLRRLYVGLDRRSASALVWGIALSVSHLALGLAWYLFFVMATRPLQGRAAPPFRWSDVPHAGVDCAFVLATWSAIYFGIRYWRRAQAVNAQLSEAVHQTERAQLAALQYQLSPHFLFNVLNSIRRSIIHDPARAREAVTRLSDLLRQTVYSPPGERTTLATELEWARNYLGLEQLRFGDRLDVAFAIDDSAAASQVPSFVLHPIVENAVKHGHRDARTPLSIRITARRRPECLEIVVANTGRFGHTTNGADSGHETESGKRSGSGGVGLANVRKRLALLSDPRNRLVLTQRADRVEVILYLAQP